METIYIKTGSYILIITLGTILKRCGVFEIRDSAIFAKLSMYICLPAAIIASFKGFEFDYSLFGIVLFGFLVNFIYVIVALIITKRRQPVTKAMYLLNMSSFNIGSFTLPFMVEIYPPLSLIYLTMFDVGNSLYCMGVNFAIAENQVSHQRTFSIRAFLFNLLRTPPFMTYIMMSALLIMKITLPSFIYDVAAVAGQANTFIVMFMFGLLFNPSLSKEGIKDVVGILGSRYTVAFVLSLLVWLFFPIATAAKQVLTIALLAPMTSVTLTYCLRLRCDEEVSSFVSSMAIPISVVLITIVYAFF